MTETLAFVVAGVVLLALVAYALWPRSKPPAPEPPMRGVRMDDMTIDAPPADASPEQWLDFAAMFALWHPYTMASQEWRKAAMRAYLAKWPAS